jgi:DNA-binding SARP family transcriptional activator
LFVQFSLLGPVEVRQQDRRVEIGGGKLQTVLGALVLAKGNVVSTDRLVNLIWPDDPPSKPYVTVRSYISHLRRQLEPEREAGERSRLLVTRSPGYALEVDPLEVDLFLFEHRVDEAAAMIEANRHEQALQTLTEALSLWNSDDLSDSPLAAFAGDVRRLLELRHRAVAMRFDALLATGQHQEIVPDLQSLVDRDPTGERHRAQLMLALYRSGRQGEAIEVFQAGVRANIDATGLDISPTLAALEHQILQNDPALDWQPQVRSTAEPAPDPAPSPVDQPLGRGEEVGLVDAAVTSRLGTASTRSTTADRADPFLAVTGEPGIGKTNLLDYAAARSRAAGASVSWGFGHNGSQSTPLVPWRTVLSDLVESVEDATLTALVGRRGPELAQLVPAIGDRLGVEPVEASDASVLRDAIAHFIIGYAAADRPLTLCFDDLHWVDLASARMLSYLLPQLQDRPILVIGSWRSTEVVEPELAEALAELGRLAAGNRIELKGLSLDAVTRLWAAADADASADSDADSSEPVDMLAELHRRTGGNPLFITELLRSRSGPDDLRPTATVNDVIATRLASLPASCAELLSVAALCLGSFGEPLLAELSGLDEDDLLDGLEALLAAGLIVEDPQDPTLFSLSHSLVGESLASQMSGLRKARLHNRIAGVLEQQRAPIGEVAHHYLAGAAVGDREAAASAALAAAKHSSKLHDHVIAIQLLRQALDVLDGAEDTQALQAELMIDLAYELKFLDLFSESHEASLEGFRLAERAGSVDQMVNAALVYCGQSGDEASVGARWMGYWNPPGPALEMLQACIDKLGAGTDRTTVLMAYASQLFGEYSDPEESLRYSNRAVDEAREAGSRELLPAALYHRFSISQRALPYEDRRDSLEECLQLALSQDLLYREVAVRRSLMVLRLDEDNIDGSRREVEAGRKLARQIDDPGMAMIADSMTIALDLYQGRLAEAEAEIGAAFATYEALGSATLDAIGIQYAVLQRELGHSDQVAEMMRWKLDGYPGPPYGMALAMVLTDLGQFDEAQALLDQYASDSTILSGGEGVLQFMTLAFYAEILIALGDRKRAEALYPALLPADGRTVAMFNGIAIYGSGSYYLGRLATLLGRTDDAARHLTLAQEHHRAVGARPYELRTLVAQAELAEADGRNDDAKARRTEAASLADSLGMGWMTSPDRPRR